jgi:hypothetical protein
MVFQQVDDSLLLRGLHQIKGEDGDNVMPTFRPRHCRLRGEEERENDCENGAEFQHGVSL